MKNIALIGTGRIGTHHAGVLASEVKGAKLTALVDPMSPNLESLAQELGVPTTSTDPMSVINDPAIDAVVICTPAATHAELIEAAAAAGKDIFTEKPVATTVADAKKAVEAAAKAGVTLQVGFNRRYAESWARSKEMVVAGAVGSVQRVHSITRDPGPFGADPAKIPAGTIFNETLIHDFDTICWLNEGSEPVDVYAVADALVAPEAKEQGFQDSSVVVIRFDNGAITTAEACFCAMYGYDLRGEVFGSGGMVQMGRPEATDARLFDSGGEVVDTSGTDTSRYHGSYVGEFQAFADRINGKDIAIPTGEDGIRAQLIASAAIKSADEGRPVRIEEVSA